MKSTRSSAITPNASVMPNVPSANTHAPTVMIGERAAELIAAAAGVGTGLASAQV